GEFIQGTKNINDFFTFFDKKTTPHFDPIKDLQKIGVVNQTTMLASETQAIAELLKEIIKNKYQENWNNHFFDTRDTLCYATNDNQEATYVLLKEKADFAIVAGGYNSSNTSHLVELCEQKLPTFFIADAREIKNQEEIQHFDIHQTKLVTSHHFLPKKEKIKIILTSGASCPDRILDEIMDKILGFFPNSLTKDELLENLKS
ncbi:MAG: 4-hydroxy-3-methylbut-2-enyl diphosphate reductase, partial [Bacteroidota bacterium]